MWKYFLLGILCSLITGIILTTGIILIFVPGGLLITSEGGIYAFLSFITSSLLTLPGGILAGFVRIFKDKKSGKSLNSPKSIRNIVLLGTALSIVSYFLFGALGYFILLPMVVEAILANAITRGEFFLVSLEYWSGSLHSLCWK